MPFCTKDMWSGGEAWMGCRGRGIADDLQTFARRHKWAMVYDIKNCELRTSLQSGNCDLASRATTRGRSVNLCLDMEGARPGFLAASLRMIGFITSGCHAALTPLCDHLGIRE